MSSLRSRYSCRSLVLLGALAGGATAQSAASAPRIGSDLVEHAAYVSDEAVNDVHELYGVPVDGSRAPVRLNLPLPAGGDVLGPFGASFLQVTGDRVLYLADAITDDVFELFSVPNDGRAAPVRLSGDLASGGDVTTFLVAKQRVVYLADETVDDVRELYSAPVDGSRARIALTAGSEVSRLWTTSRDGALAAFLAPGANQSFLHVVRTDGRAPPVFLMDSGQPLGFAVTYFWRIEFSPDGRHLFCITVHDDDSVPAYDLFAIRADGSAPGIRLNATPGAAGASFRIAPDGARVVFTEREGDVEGAKLRSIRPDGTGLVDLNPDGGLVRGENYLVGENGAYAVFVSQASASSGPYTLLAARLDGSATLPLLPPAADAIHLVDAAPGALVFVTRDAAQRHRLFSLVAPYQPRNLSGDPPPGQGVDFQRFPQDPTLAPPIVLTPDGKRVVFRADLSSDEVYGLYSAPLDASAPYVELNEPLSGAGDVSSFRLDSYGGRVLYKADALVDGRDELFSVPVDGASAPIRLNDPPVAGGDVSAYLPEPRPSVRAVRGP